MGKSRKWSCGTYSEYKREVSIFSGTALKYSLLNALKLRTSTYAYKFCFPHNRRKYCFFFFLPVDNKVPFPPISNNMSLIPFWSLSLTLLFLFLSFIFSPPSVQREWAAYLGAWCPPVVLRSCFVEVAQHSNDLLVNLWGRKWSPHPIPQPYFPVSKITADGDCSHEIKRCLLLGRKAVTNLDTILTSRDITLPTKVCLINAMVFPVVMHGCESWTMKKAEHWRIHAFELWCWRRLLKVPWTARRSNQSIQKEISSEYIHWKAWCRSWNSNILAILCEELTHWKRPWCLERLKAEGEGDDRGWDSWMASLMWWTWVWVSSGSWWWTGKPGVLQSVRSQRVQHDWVTELNWISFWVPSSIFFSVHISMNSLFMTIQLFSKTQQALGSILMSSEPSFPLYLKSVLLPTVKAI